MSDSPRSADRAAAGGESVLLAAIGLGLVALTLALFAPAVFLVHPQRLESVVWISERKDVLATLFWLLTLLAYVRHTELLREIDAGTARLIREQLDARVSRDGDPVE